jgi:hypothetical protein
MYIATDIARDALADRKGVDGVFRGLAAAAEIDTDMSIRSRTGE